MTLIQDDDAEWHNPKNWKGGILGLYYSPRDRRTFVPKRHPNLGITLNFARRGGIAVLLGILAFPVLVHILTRAVRGVRP